MDEMKFMGYPVQFITLKPDSIVVIKVDNFVSEKNLNYIKDETKKVFPKNKVLVFNKKYYDIEIVDKENE